MSFHLFFKRFFLTWTIFKVFIESVTILLLLVLFWSFGPTTGGILTPLTEDWTLTSCTGRWHLNHWTARGFYLPSVLKGLQSFYGGEKNTRKMTYPDDTDGRRGRRGPFNVAFGSFSKILDSGLYPVPFRGTAMVGQAAPPTKTGMGTTVNSILCIVFRLSYQCLTLAVCAVDDRVLIMPTDCMIFTLSVNSCACWLINTCCCIYIKFCLCPLGPVLGLENQPPCIQRIKNKICDTDCGKCTS